MLEQQGLAKHRFPINCYTSRRIGAGELGFPRPGKADDDVSTLVDCNGAIEEIQARLLNQPFLQELIGARVDLKPLKRGLAIVEDRLDSPQCIILQDDTTMQSTAVRDIQVRRQARLHGTERPNKRGKRGIMAL